MLRRVTPIPATPLHRFLTRPPLCIASRRLERVSRRRMSTYCSVYEVGGAERQSSDAVQSPASDITAVAGSCVTVTFRWPSALNATHVSVAGTFSNWQPVELYKDNNEGDFIGTVKIPIGEHEYKFLADDEWKIYPSDPVTVDEHGNCNNHLSAYPTVSFCQWKELLPLEYDADGGCFFVECYLQPGLYDFLFLVDGQWRTLPSEPSRIDTQGRQCNEVAVSPYDAYRVYYATGWEHATMRARLRSTSGETTVWKDVTLCDTRSRSGFFGVNWKVATAVTASFPTDRCESIHSLEFYVVNEDGTEDHPLHGKYYRCPVIGGYKLQNGVLKPFSKSVHGPVMLVSDLDGTMVSGDGESDAAMHDFSFYWENNASLYNSVLVYNTGRSLGQFTYLLQEKEGALSLPDVVITAVGTKIFHLSTRGRGRSRASGLDWVEDVNWSSCLDQGWNLDLVRQAGNNMIANLSTERANWLDYGEEHPHRVAFSVRVDDMDTAKRILLEHLSHHNLQVHLIVSGTGGWRYLDCVPVNGGKLEALEYVRKYFGIPVHRCVSAGDSCNDILMLEGKNPAIVVGNAQEELCQWLLSQPQTNRVVYTDAHHARGIIEGLSRLGLY